MDNTKFTKGKWELTNRNRGVEVLIKPSTYKSICTTTGNTKWQFDMLLISKAPEMLEMLNKALIIINDLDSANSDMMNELYQTKVYKNFTKHSSFCDKLEKLIKEATEL